MKYPTADKNAKFAIIVLNPEDWVGADSDEIQF
jgi:hypothetical protein